MWQWLRAKRGKLTDYFDQSTIQGEERVGNIVVVGAFVAFCFLLFVLFSYFQFESEQKKHRFQTQYIWVICTPAVQDSSGQYHVLVKQIGSDGKAIVRKANFSAKDISQGIINMQFSNGSETIAMKKSEYRVIWRVPKSQIKTQVKTKPKSVS